MEENEVRLEQMEIKKGRLGKLGRKKEKCLFLSHSGQKETSVKMYHHNTSEVKWQAQIQGNFKRHDIGLSYKSENYK